MGFAQRGTYFPFTCCIIRKTSLHQSWISCAYWTQLNTDLRGSAVGRATGYGMDHRRIGVRVPVGWRIFTFLCRPDRIWGPRITNSVAWVSERTIPTAVCRRSWCQFLRLEGVTWSAWRIPMAVFSAFRPEPLPSIPSSSSVVLTRLGGPRSRPTASHKIW
jgi:hypothetical protein